MKKAILYNLFIILILSFALTACMKPPKIELIETIETNETAFLVPLEGATQEGQAQFMSIDYLNQAKVATKRVTIPQRERKIGRWNHEIEWIPTMKLIRVNRSPITREWTERKETGTTEKDDAIYVESLDSIGFFLGVNITTLVEEKDSSAFLYYYAGKPLKEVTDENVRGFVSSILSREFGSRNLQACKSDKKTIQEILGEEVSEQFRYFGVTITNIGLVGGLTYDDPEIQGAINAAYVAEMKIQENEKLRDAQVAENERLVSIAKAEKEAAQEFAKAYDAIVKKTELEIEMKKAEAMLVAANKWNGTTPSSILPQGSNLLFGLDK